MGLVEEKKPEEKKDDKPVIEGEFKEQDAKPEPAAESSSLPAVITVESMHGLALIGDPDKIVEDARKAAAALMKIINAKPKPVVLNGEKYWEIDDWTLAGQFYGVAAKTKFTRPVEVNGAKGWEAGCELIDLTTGHVVGYAESICLDNEEQWGKRPEYKWMDEKEAIEKYGAPAILDRAAAKWNKNQIRAKVLIGTVDVPETARRSMAQTRAASRALAMRLRFVALLAGVKGTPAEEMPRYQRGETDEAAAPPKKPMDEATVIALKVRIKELKEAAEKGTAGAGDKWVGWTTWMKSVGSYEALFADEAFIENAKRLLGIVAVATPTKEENVAGQPLPHAGPPDQMQAHGVPTKWHDQDRELIRSTYGGIQKMAKDKHAKAVAVVTAFKAFMDKHNLDWTGQAGRTSIWTKPEYRDEVYKILEMPDDMKPDMGLGFDPDAVPQ